MSTFIATVNAFTGAIRVHVPSEDSDIATLDGQTVFTQSDVTPWGEDEMEMDRADSALTSLGWTRVSEWDDRDNEAITATVMLTPVSRDETVRSSAENADSYQGWTNRETWAAALHINNDQGWQESVLEDIRAEYDDDTQTPSVNRAGELVRESVESFLSPVEEVDVRSSMFGQSLHGELFSAEQVGIMREIGSMWRVNWAELGASFLSAAQEN